MSGLLECKVSDLQEKKTWQYNFKFHIPQQIPFEDNETDDEI